MARPENPDDNAPDRIVTPFPCPPADGHAVIAPNQVVDEGGEGHSAFGLFGIRNTSTGVTAATKALTVSCDTRQSVLRNVFANRITVMIVATMALL